MTTVPAGRIAGIDFGTRRVGIALSDPGQNIATPLATYVRRSLPDDTAYFRSLVEQEAIRSIVVGLPLHMSGDESQKSREARAFGAWLGLETGVPVFFVDERYSTTLANQLMEEAGIPSAKRQKLRDKMAAQVILQTFLESTRDNIPHG